MHTARLAATTRRLRTGQTDLGAYRQRLVERFESTESTIESFLPETDRWERIAGEIDALEQRYPDPGERPSLFGAPVGIKDIIHVEGFETRAGASVPPEELAGSEAAVISALESAGAVVLGKTVTTEFAYFDPGPTRNPHDTDHTPGGSSSGSAAAVAAGLCPLALGSQTIGSVNRPAAFCGVVGLKPSYERIPIDGVLPVAPSVDHVGFFTQTVEGAQLAAGVLYDGWRAEDRPGAQPTIGAVEGPYLKQASQTGRDHFEQHLDALRAAGFDVRRFDPFDDIEAVNERHNRLVAAETALSHDELYPTYGETYSAELTELIEEGLSVETAGLASARAGRRRLREELHASMDDHAVDVIVSPSAPGPAPKGLDSTGDPVMNLPWTHSGLPTISIPASTTDDGLPIGLQCSARFGYDEWLLSWSESIETALSNSG
ncbi:MAG: amidase [Natronomonas sp.]